MPSFGRLFDRIWADEDFRKLSASEQQLYCLLISFSTRNLAGVLPMTLKRWAKCTADATEKKITSAMQSLETARFIVADHDTEEVLVRTLIKNDEVYKQPNLMKAALKDVQKTESPLLRGVLQQELLGLPDHKESQLTRNVALSLVKTPTEGFPKASGSHPDGIAEDNLSLDLPIAEGSGIGTYVSSKDVPVPDTEHLVPVTPLRRGTRLRDGWQPPDQIIREMKDEFPHVDLRAEHAKFCDYWQAKAGKDAVKLDWDRTWRNWIRNAAERTSTRNGTTPPLDSKSSLYQAMKTPDRQELE